MEILGIGYQEILLVAALIVIVVGPSRLPEMAYHLGRGVKKLQRYARVVRDEFGEEFAYLNEEMEAVRADMQEVRSSVREVQDELVEVRGEVEEATAEVQGGVREATAPAGGRQGLTTTPTPAPARNGAAEAEVNGSPAPRGVPGPAYMPPIATLQPREEPAAPPPETRPEAEVEDESEAQPAKPLVF